ncbi:thiopurine S-methyltransferase [Stutzerimonas stutzeri]|uniref:thiopurine S-methyltransferase n=1 Tax=Stutzerimonas sp. S1 TaxID=3030652 RepID=UPI002224C4CF|nr:thiopurine S-methyltransferase [Stutzerimonas sp. S1]
MHEEFWQERWARNEIGFHLKEFNPYLRRHWSRLALAEGAQVLVPLCGKSLDLIWLAGQGLQVLGVELSERAVEAFFAEQGLQPTVTRQAAFRIYRCGSLEIRCGDFFELGVEDVAGCRAFYDRAALIALPPEMRRRYTEHLARILPDGCQGLLITLDYDQSQMAGPPFAVDDVEVNRLLGAFCHVQLLEQEDVLQQNWKFLQRGLERLHESTYLLRKCTA